MRLSIFSVTAIVAFCTASTARATDIHLIGIFGNKATLMVDSGKPRTLAEGDTSPESIRLISIGTDSAVIEIGGKRETIRMGNQRIAGTRGDAGASKVTLTGDARGHYVTTAQVNGVSMQFIVDTGASAVTIGTDDAKRARINYTTAPKGLMQTANGVVAAYRVKIDTVSLGGITLNQIDGVVVEGNALGRYGLLGMSFLTRMDMRREGDSMTLTKRF
jgi:aspartyl protease family protein